MSSQMIDGTTEISSCLARSAPNGSTWLVALRVASVYVAPGGRCLDSGDRRFFTRWVAIVLDIRHSPLNESGV